MSTAAVAGPTATVVAGGVVGGGDTVGGALGARLGYRAERSPWGARVEGAFVTYAGFGPHSGARGYHLAVAAQRRLSAHRLHVLFGFAGEWRARAQEVTGFDERAAGLGPHGGVGVTVGAAQFELTLTVPVLELDRSPDSELDLRGQAMATVAIGLP